MRDIFRWVLHWLASVPGVVVANLDVEISDHAKHSIMVSDHAKYTIALSDKTRGP
jgi:hypothetical protein